MRIHASYMVLALISTMYLLLFLGLIKEAFMVSGTVLGLSLYVINAYLDLSQCISRVPLIHISDNRIRWREEAEVSIRHPCKEASIEAQVDPHLSISVIKHTDDALLMRIRGKWIGAIENPITIRMTMIDRLKLIKVTRMHSLPTRLIIEPPQSIEGTEAEEGTYMSLKPYDYLEPATHMHWLTSARLNQLIIKSPRDLSLRGNGTVAILEWSECMSEGSDVRRIDKALALLSAIQVSSLCLAGPNGCIKVKPDIYEVERLYWNPPEIAVFTNAIMGRRTIVITSMKCIDFSSLVLMMRQLPSSKIILATPEPRTIVDTRGLPVEVI
ncbi:MAG: hypothetical protein RXO28_00245 [Thermocladium sp.]|jgi:hypothetical protein